MVPIVKKNHDCGLQLVGITGTAGKTTTTLLVQFILNKLSNRFECGFVGSIYNDVGAGPQPTIYSTPPPDKLHPLLQQIREKGASCAAMEVSSHGLVQQRTAGLSFTVAAFTNLSQEHLDYHPSMEDYFLAKRRLFCQSPYPRSAVIWADDAYGARLLSELPPQVRALTVGTNEGCAFLLKHHKATLSGSVFEVQTPLGPITYHTRLPGFYNLSNCLVALGICYALGVDLMAIKEPLAAFPGAPGRMQHIAGPQGAPAVFVDYAHKPAALQCVLSMLRQCNPEGKLLVVFGCGGDRDRTKRPLMVQAVQSFADHAWATADNPRTEPLEQIFSDMRSGVTNPQAITFHPDRAQAIELAIQATGPRDTVLIAGKGHEAYQEINDVRIPFCDVTVATEILYNRQ